MITFFKDWIIDGDCIERILGTLMILCVAGIAWLVCYGVYYFKVISICISSYAVHKAMGFFP